MNNSFSIILPFLFPSRYSLLDSAISLKLCNRGHAFSNEYGDKISSGLSAAIRN